MDSFLAVFDERCAVPVDRPRFLKLLAWYVESERLECLEDEVSVKAHKPFFAVLSQLLADSDDCAFRMALRLLRSMNFSFAFSESGLVTSLERMSDSGMAGRLMRQVFETGENELLAAVLGSERLVSLFWQLFFDEKRQAESVGLAAALFSNVDEPAVLGMAREADRLFLHAVSAVRPENCRKFNQAIAALLSNVVSVCSRFERRENPLRRLGGHEEFILSQLSLFPSEFEELASLIWPTE